MSRLIICDRCGKEITGELAGKISWRLTVSLTDLVREEMFQHDDYCESCMEEIKQCIAGRQQPGPEPKPKRKRNPGGKMGAPKQIDRGKVFALRNAGWTAAKIADEMKCSLGTVKRILQEEAPYEQDERVFID